MPNLTGGSNNLPANVTEENRLEVSASSYAEDHEAALDSDSYTMDIDGIQTDGANYWLAVIKNGDDNDLIVTSVTMWIQGFSEDSIIEAYTNSTFTYASNGTAVVPANLRSGVSGGAEGEFYVNDGTGNITTITAGAVAGRFIFGTTPTKWEKKSGWIIPKGQTFMLWANENGKVLYGYISFYYHRSCMAIKGKK